MTRRTLSLVAAITATTALQAAFVSSAHAVVGWDFEDGTTQQWGPSFNTPWSNTSVGAYGATDGGSGYGFNIPGGFTFGNESNTRPGAFGAETPREAARWDAFVASNLLLTDISATGTNAPEGPEGDALRAQYVAMWPALNGRGPASGLPPTNPDGSPTYTFIGSFDRPIDLENGFTARYQINFSPAYFAGVRTHTMSWDYVNAGYDFSLLTPANADQNYTLLHWTTNTDAANPYAGRLALDNIRIYRAKATDPTYSGTAAGTFDASNFANNFVSGTGAIAIFKKIDTIDAATVNVNSGVTVGTLMLNNTPRSSLLAPIPGTPTSYTFGGTGTLTLDNGTAEAALVAIDGDNVITAPLAINSNAVIDLAADPSQDGVPQAPATLAVGNVTLAAGKTLRTTSVGALTLNGNLIGGAGSTLAVNGGSTALAGTGRRISVSNLTVAPSARLDVRGNAVTVDYTGTSPLADLTAAIVAGRLGSSTATGSQAVGIIEASAFNSIGTSFLGQMIDATTVLIRTTFRGDSDLNGTVAFADLVTLAQNYQGGIGKLWSQGDTNYDGLVNFTDLVSLAQNYNQTLSASQLDVLGADFASDFALASSLVPEPTTLLGLGAVAAMIVRRRR